MLFFALIVLALVVWVRFGGEEDSLKKTKGEASKLRGFRDDILNLFADLWGIIEVALDSVLPHIPVSSKSSKSNERKALDSLIKEKLFGVQRSFRTRALYVDDSEDYTKPSYYFFFCRVESSLAFVTTQMIGPRDANTFTKHSTIYFLYKPNEGRKAFARRVESFGRRDHDDIPSRKVFVPDPSGKGWAESRRGFCPPISDFPLSIQKVRAALVEHGKGARDFYRLGLSHTFVVLIEGYSEEEASRIVMAICEGQGGDFCYIHQDIPFRNPSDFRELSMKISNDDICYVDGLDEGGVLGGTIGPDPFTSFLYSPFNKDRIAFFRFGSRITSDMKDRFKPDHIITNTKDVES